LERKQCGEKFENLMIFFFEREIPKKKTMVKELDAC
jgi:hypothetical protein